MSNLPVHIAIVPDGNRRWAQLNGVSALQGHKKGANTMLKVVDYMADRGIKYLTLWGFSTDNWTRTPEEVENILTLLTQWLDSHTLWVHGKGIKLRYLGRFHELPTALGNKICEAVQLTRHNTGMVLNIALNYSGRAEILDAVNRINQIPDQRVGETLFNTYLYTAGMPDVDLVIRTAGDYRISNFMLWQTAYSELYFTDVLWPDFDEKEIEKALSEYSERKRRFGGD